MKDTIQTIIKTVESSSLDGIELINKVDSFYNSAWDKLIVSGSLALAVIGLLVPYLIQWYQKKNLKISEELLKRDIENQSLKLKSELLDDINKTLEEKIQEFETKLEKMQASTYARAHHLQANLQTDNGDFLGAYADYYYSAQEYLLCEDFVNLNIVLKIILNDCLPELSVEEINDVKISDGYDLEFLLENVKAKDVNGTFVSIVSQIRLKLSKMPKTIKEKSTLSK
jgi:hypothetical protein